MDTLSFIKHCILSKHKSLFGNLTNKIQYSEWVWFYKRLKQNRFLCPGFVNVDRYGNFAKMFYKAFRNQSHDLSYQCMFSNTALYTTPLNSSRLISFCSLVINKDKVAKKKCFLNHFGIKQVIFGHMIRQSVFT